MDKDIMPLQYIAALEEKLTEQVRINEDLFKTVLEQEAEIIRLENRLRQGGGGFGVDELLSLNDCKGEA